ncbi:PAS domain-containing sensor histidine kinase [Magnetospirillum sulfuroxidans]|uniref:histidine kinase n=1 Tax=Magnetospirillum sulfuroxidans TaxID=611300 RepID=A0ABS5IB85_9PROT|nr:PAS domain-containing sensor histidine kinase [Magnetospirillum sulfuroxidans]MBR9970968.1 PAS domain-containing protein [Magnetospirillum sulfuroxidans]
MRVVFWLVAGLVLAIWALALREFGSQYQRYRVTQELIGSNATVDHLLLVGRNLIFERGRVNLRLAAVSPQDDVSVDFIARLRRSGQEQLTAAMPGLAVEMAADLTARWRALEELRSTIDPQLAVPLAQRDGRIRELWYRESTEFLGKLQQILHLQALRGNRFDPSFRLLTRVKLATLSLRDALGEESTRIGAAAAQGAVLNAAALYDLARLRGKSDAILAAIRSDIDAANQPHLRAALDAVQVDLQERLHPLQDEIIGRSQAGHHMVLPASSYSSVAVPVLDGVMRLFDAAQAHCDLKVKGIQRRATVLMGVSLALTVVALVLGGLALVILRHRLLRPLRTIGADLRSLIAGQVPLIDEGGANGDELDDMRAAVVAFRNILSDRQALWDALPDLICLKDESGRWRGANGAAVRSLQLTALDVRGKTDDEIMQAFPHLRLWLQAGVAGDMVMWKSAAPVTREEVIAGIQGEPAFFQVMRIPLFHADGTRRGQAIIGRNVTDHRRAETAAARLAHQNLLILECAGEGITGIDAEGRTIFFNRAASRMTGWDVEELIGLPQHQVLHHTHTDGTAHPMAECPIWQTLADGIARHCDQDVFWCKDGSPLPVEFSVNPLIEKDLVRGAVVIFRDIRARLSAEAEIGSLLAELKRSNTELERFAYVASHDLRQPLRMINGYMSLIKKRLADKLGTDEETFFNFATDGARRMDRMICDLLDYSRIGRSRDMEPVDLGAVLSTAIDNMAAAIGESGAVVTVASGLPMVTGIGSELERLFSNLIANAIKFRRPEIVPEISVGCAEDGDFWVLSVRDNGIGIAPKDHPRLFAIFQRLVPQEQYEGTGIGLASVRKIAEHHRGRVWVESELGQGATFHVALPKAAAI